MQHPFPITFQTAAASYTAEPGGTPVFEALVGERINVDTPGIRVIGYLSFPPDAEAVDLFDPDASVTVSLTGLAEDLSPTGDVPAVSPEFQLNTVGRYACRVYTKLGERDITIVACEQAALTRAGNRSVLRSLATHAPFFDGTDASLLGHGLAAYGAAR